MAWNCFLGLPYVFVILMTADEFIYLGIDLFEVSYLGSVVLPGHLGCSP